MTWTCAICREPVDYPLRHVRDHHPNLDATPDTWPDGALVLIDTTLEPKDFK